MTYRAAPLGLFLLGAIFVFMSSYNAIKDYAFNQHTITTQGIIIDNQVNYSGTKVEEPSFPLATKSSFPTVQFNANDGKIIKFKSQKAASGTLKTGDLVYVSYNSQDPNNAQLSDKVSVTNDVLMAIFGLVLCFAGYLFMRNKRQPQF